MCITAFLDDTIVFHAPQHGIHGMSTNVAITLDNVRRWYSGRIQIVFITYAHPQNGIHGMHALSTCTHLEL